MAFLDTIRNFLLAMEPAEAREVTPAPETVYEIHPLTDKQLREVLKLNMRCFERGEHYTRQTFAFLLNDPTTLSYRVATPDEAVVAFVFVMSHQNGTAHITTIGVAPEHRRRGLAALLMSHIEEAVRARGLGTLTLEVRVSNIGAQSLYRGLGYSTVQRLTAYYNNGEDAFLMVKSLP